MVHLIMIYPEYSKSVLHLSDLIKSLGFLFCLYIWGQDLIIKGGLFSLKVEMEDGQESLFRKERLLNNHTIPCKCLRRCFMTGAFQRQNYILSYQRFKGPHFYKTIQVYQGDKNQPWRNSDFSSDYSSIYYCVTLDQVFKFPKCKNISFKWTYGKRSIYRTISSQNDVRCASQAVSTLIKRCLQSLSFRAQN